MPFWYNAGEWIPTNYTPEELGSLMTQLNSPTGNIEKVNFTTNYGLRDLKKYRIPIMVLELQVTMPKSLSRQLFLSLVNSIATLPVNVHTIRLLTKKRVENVELWIAVNGINRDVQYVEDVIRGILISGQLKLISLTASKIGADKHGRNDSYSLKLRSSNGTAYSGKLEIQNWKPRTNRKRNKSRSQSGQKIDSQRDIERNEKRDQTRPFDQKLRSLMNQISWQTIDDICTKVIALVQNSQESMESVLTHLYESLVYKMAREKGECHIEFNGKLLARMCVCRKFENIHSKLQVMLQQTLAKNLANASIFISGDEACDTNSLTSVERMIVNTTDRNSKRKCYALMTATTLLLFIELWDNNIFKDEDVLDYVERNLDATPRDELFGRILVETLTFLQKKDPRKARVVYQKLLDLATGLDMHNWHTKAKMSIENIIEKSKEWQKTKARPRIASSVQISPSEKWNTVTRTNSGSSKSFTYKPQTRKIPSRQKHRRNRHHSGRIRKTSSHDSSLGSSYGSPGSFKSSFGKSPSSFGSRSFDSFSDLSTTSNGNSSSFGRSPRTFGMSPHSPTLIPTRPLIGKDVETRIVQYCKGKTNDVDYVFPATIGIQDFVDGLFNCMQKVRFKESKNMIQGLARLATIYIEKNRLTCKDMYLALETLEPQLEDITMDVPKFEEYVLEFLCKCPFKWENKPENVFHAKEILGERIN